MDAEPPRCTLQDAKAQEILDRRAVVSRDGDAAGAQRVGERTRAVAHERRFLARLGQVHGDGEPFPTRQLGRRRYNGSLTVYGACGDTPRRARPVASGRSRRTAAASSLRLAPHFVGSGPKTSW